MAELMVSALGKVYADGTRAVHDLNLEIRDGEFVVLVGPSGCGKSTALRMVAGLESVTTGLIRIGERVVNTVPARDRDVAMVFQNYALYPHLNVYENIAFSLRLRGIARAELDRRVREVAGLLDLAEHLHRKPRVLSNGQRQRVAMGRAIIRQPQVFLMDEPLSNLDVPRRARVRAQIARLQKDLATTTLYVTHDQTEAMTLGDRVVVMRHGVLLQIGSPQEVYERPADLFVAGFVGSPGMNLMLATLTESEPGRVLVGFQRQSLTLPAGVLHRRPGLRRFLGRQVAVGIRPEDMEDSEIAGDAPGGVLHSVAELVESMGSDVLVHFPVEATAVPTEHEDRADPSNSPGPTGPSGLSGPPGAARDSRPSRTVLVGRFSPRSRVFEGQRIGVWVDTSQLHFFDPADGAAIWHE